VSTPHHVCWRSALTSLLVLACSVGCASLREPMPPGFERVSLRAEVARNGARVEGDLNAHTTAQGAIIGAAIGVPIGAILGFGAGTGISIAACDDWPDLIVCIPAWMFGGMFGGAVVGSATGALIGSLDGLPSETAEKVEARLVRLEEGRKFDDELLAALRAAVPQAKQVDAADAEATVTARLDEFDLTQHLRDRLSVRLRASLVQVWQPPGEAPKQNTCSYRYASEKRDAAAWLADDGAFRKAVDEGVWTMARWMARDLEAFAAQKELPATTTEPASCFREARSYR
jgi:hypothetical protein